MLSGFSTKRTRDIEVGVGDDCAVARLGDTDLVLCADMLVEHIHFETSYFDPRDIGYKAVAVNLSDIAAMGANAVYLLCTLSGPKSYPLGEILTGIQDACDHYDISLVGGDISRSAEITASVSVIGTRETHTSLLRSKASPGDEIVLTGPTGLSAAGLRSLSQKRTRPMHPSLFELAHLRPLPLLKAGRAALSHGVKAGIDISDSLALDLHRVSDASNVGFELSHIPIVDGVSPEEALFGGEDYELLLFTKDGASLAALLDEILQRAAATVIGVVTEDKDLRTLRGKPLPKKGFLH